MMAVHLEVPSARARDSAIIIIAYRPPPVTFGRVGEERGLGGVRGAVTQLIVHRLGVRYHTWLYAPRAVVIIDHVHTAIN